MRFSAALLGSQLLIASTIYANPIATDKALAPAIAARNGLGTLLAPNDGDLVARDASLDEDLGNNGCGKLKRDAEVAARAASDTFTKYLTARSLIGRDADAGEDQAKRDAAAAATEAATAYEKYARSLEK